MSAPMTDEEHELLRETIRNDPALSSAVKMAMELFWRRLDELEKEKRGSLKH